MDSEEFVSGVKVNVRDGATQAVLRILESPGGRSPPQAWVELHRWYESLSDDDRNAVRRVVELSTDMPTYGFLCVLDGFSKVFDTSADHRLELFVNAGAVRTWLNSPNAEELTAIYKDGA